jgi:hypothetical protein
MMAALDLEQDYNLGDKGKQTDDRTPWRSLSTQRKSRTWGNPGCLAELILYFLRFFIAQMLRTARAKALQFRRCLHQV